MAADSGPSEADRALPFEIDAATLADLLGKGTELRILDVREPWELEICRFPGSLDIPLGMLPARRKEVPADVPVVAVCHHGMRSRQAAMWLRAQGLDNVANLDGGIDAWAKEIDTSMGTY
jgi:rhodanese-related sulfurtransferase